MKKGLILAAALALAGAPAVAADMPVKAPPVPYVDSDWGGSISAAMSRDDRDRAARG